MLDTLMAGLAPSHAEVLIAPEGVVRRQSTDLVHCQCIRRFTPPKSLETQALRGTKRLVR